MAEADGNRTRLTRFPGHAGFEDREVHQQPKRLRTVNTEATPVQNHDPAERITK